MTDKIFRFAASVTVSMRTSFLVRKTLSLMSQSYLLACCVPRSLASIVALDGGKSNLSSAERSGDTPVTQPQDRNCREHHRNSSGEKQIVRGVCGRFLRQPAIGHLYGQHTRRMLLEELRPDCQALLQEKP